MVDNISKRSPTEQEQSSGSGRRTKTRSRVSKVSSNISNQDHGEAKGSPIRKKTESSSSHSKEGEFKPDQKVQMSTSAATEVSRHDFEKKSTDRELSPISCNSKDLIED